MTDISVKNIMQKIKADTTDIPEPEIRDIRRISNQKKAGIITRLLQKARRFIRK